ncbi:hypothetical protein EUC41_01250 [Achromobacter denitrificans]|uniref:hypothetical protein n=1 Tax=Achromobacter denitrificans TaxID=32002 RepID=UPI000B48D8E9|nr:hypothetical protein [Achromobacter denitrificans]MDX3879671.1 hypothetical protein [Achromobacter sp.]MBV2159101.1 hypothetical protein [Achromobacter denitrificans]MDF3857435.1 hypothetical protein [Achromobacter denitrificans]MPT39683.1 hypothetical protein [Achromobacter sp.]QCS65585.1 hypothetical protein EC609_26000 [Achromobacter denitrificans]
MKLNRQQIHGAAMQVLEAHPQGIRWADLLRAVVVASPETPRNSIRGAVHNLLSTRTAEITKVARGTYQLTKFVEADDAAASAKEHEAEITPVPAGSPELGTLVEKDFYASFAEWLVENDEATVAVELGGSTLGGKWGTPDVMGVLKPRAQDIFKFEPQIVTAEIKAVPSQPVVAFGQAVAYRLFSHRSYIVVPNSTSGDDMSRLTSLCSIHGVGLVTFSLDKAQPDYVVAVLPVNASPDMFYVNSVLDRLKSSNPELLNKLF